MTDDQRLEEIQKRWKAAETGEGYYSRRDGWDAFVEHAHEDIAYLLERLERAREELKRWRGLSSGRAFDEWVVGIKKAEVQIARGESVPLADVLADAERTYKDRITCEHNILVQENRVLQVAVEEGRRWGQQVHDALDGKPLPVYPDEGPARIAQLREIVEARRGRTESTSMESLWQQAETALDEAEDELDEVKMKSGKLQADLSATRTRLEDLSLAVAAYLLVLDKQPENLGLRVEARQNLERRLRGESVVGESDLNSPPIHTKSTIAEPSR